MGEIRTHGHNGGLGGREASWLPTFQSSTHFGGGQAAAATSTPALTVVGGRVVVLFEPDERDAVIFGDDSYQHG